MKEWALIDGIWYEVICIGTVFVQIRDNEEYPTLISKIRVQGWKLA